MPLSMAKEKELFKIEKILGGNNLRQRLSAMGLYEGNTVKVYSNGSTGPIIVVVANSKIAIGRGMAQKIMVTPAT